MSIYLFILEFKFNFIIKTKSELLIDNSKSSSSFKINVDLTMHHIPCHILNMEINDFTGDLISNIKGTLVKQLLNKDGKIVKMVSSFMNKDFEIRDAIKALEESQGCRLTGSFSVMRAPGNFHVAFHSLDFILREYSDKGKIIKFNLTHTIHHISFEEEKDISLIREKFDEGIIFPLDGTHFVDNTQGNLMNYYINIIPTEYEDINSKTYKNFQFTFKQRKVYSEANIPSIFFRYDISPMKMKYTKYYHGHFDFLINICAIFGGMFTILGIIDSILLKLFRSKRK